MNIRVRIAPSPTGSPHIGTIYIALYNYAFAKKNKGTFLIRIEDTDTKRSTLKSEKEIKKFLKWFNLKYDEGFDKGKFGPYKQSNRIHIYKLFIKRILENKISYLCYCDKNKLKESKDKQKTKFKSTKYDSFCRNKNYSNFYIKNNFPVIRIKIPMYNKINFIDNLRGKIYINSKEIDEQILFKSDGFPTYHFANILDDYLMKISHVIRGEEWMSSTPKHVFLYKIFGWKKPFFFHLPLLRNLDKSKISKRKNIISLEYFRDSGYLSSAILNFLGLISYSISNNEYFDINFFINNFDIYKISLGSPVFDENKLLFINKLHIKEYEKKNKLISEFKKNVLNNSKIIKVFNLIKDRINKIEDFFLYTSFFFSDPLFDDFIKDNYFINSIHEINYLSDIADKILEIKNFSASNLEKYFRKICKKNNLETKKVFMLLRMVLTGKKNTPPLFDIMSLIGKYKCFLRIKKFLYFFKELNHHI